MHRQPCRNRENPTVAYRQTTLIPRAYSHSQAERHPPQLCLRLVHRATEPGEALMGEDLEEAEDLKRAQHSRQGQGAWADQPQQLLCPVLLVYCCWSILNVSPSNLSNPC